MNEESLRAQFRSGTNKKAKLSSRKKYRQLLRWIDFFGNKYLIRRDDVAAEIMEEGLQRKKIGE